MRSSPRCCRRATTIRSSAPSSASSRPGTARATSALSRASIGNLLAGCAPRSFLTAATLDDPAREIGRSHVLDWFFISPYSYVRWTLLSIGEVIKELVQARAAARTGLREPRGFPYPLARAATNVLLRHLSTALVIEEMWRRSSPIYVDFVDYDEIAHHSGPDRVEGRDAAWGRLASLSFPGLPGRAPREMIDAAYPGLIDGLVRHPGIGLVMVRATGRGAIVHGAGGTHDLADGAVDGVDPLMRFGPTGE